MDRSDDPAPATAHTLQTFFSAFSTTYHPIWTPSPSGESIEELYGRLAYVLARMIQVLDAASQKSESVLLCTHAAALPIIGRVLTGKKPQSPTEEDFVPWTASLSTFRRCCIAPINIPSHPSPNNALPRLDWEDGIGVGGRWECLANADCSFLSHGPQRGWRFSGQESFNHTIASHGLDAGTGLGHIIEQDKVTRKQ